jgi:GT2 family glycosyltransferase
MRNVLKIWIEYQTIKRSGLFDPGYYLFHNPDIRDMDPLSHFIGHGWKEGRNPSQDFDTGYYLETNPDVKAAGTNPLVHYVRYGQKEGRARNPRESPSNGGVPVGGNPDFSRSEARLDISLVLDLLEMEPRVPLLALEEPVDLLIPVYNGRELLDGLLTSIVKNTSIPYRLLIANDKSPDPLMSEYLTDFKLGNPNLDITILENKANAGFVKTVNQLAGLTRNHFVILNTDTEVPPHWLERLMQPILTNEQIASTTPFSNAGVICSFPDFLEDNPLFENLDVATLDSFFQYVNVEKNDVEVPTGVGFCMGINKNVWNTVGRFDERFGRGYGEENDWCTRAIKAGYKNLIVPNLFVYHKHGCSFPGEEKKELGEKNSELLRKRHPDYFARVADFIQRDPLKDLRTVLKIKILSQAEKPRLILDHALGGGANAYSNLLISQENLSVVIMPDGEVARNYVVRFGGQKMEEACFPMENIRDAARILIHFNVREILLNELIGYPKPKILELADVLINLKQENPQIELSFMAHDFFSVCPIYNLLDYKIRYCGVPPTCAIVINA